MRIPTPLRLLLAPAALLAAACDDTTSPNEPLEVDEATPPARAETGLPEATGRWADGYLLADLATTPSYQPNPGYSYNRSGGPITVTKVAGTTGRYIVRFSGLSALLGTKHTVRVTGWGIDGTYCKPVGARLASDTVQVRCFTIGTGAATNGRFLMLVAGKGEDRAFAYAHRPTATDYSPAGGSWNFFGTSRVFRDGAGRYRVIFNGLGAKLSATVGGHVQVNAVGTGKVYCKVIEWGGSPDVTVNVGCFTPAGAPADGKFSVHFVLPAQLMGYAWANQPSLPTAYNAVPVYSWSPAGGAVIIDRQDVGSYGITWPYFGNTVTGLPQATAFGAGGEQCKVTGFGTRTATVKCFAPNGAPVDTHFTVLLHT